ncbi:hypothetical protein [Streptomyces sp. NBC_01794]|uniref:hypothetical protein n=1 Tax=Streptomyces sp. NBC_01794 TaxID=2975942 RepID=UPI00308B86D8|nr:hypothetical protein OIE54_16200 [Streptomyces sp. NBC_01794]
MTATRRVSIATLLAMTVAVTACGAQGNSDTGTDVKQVSMDEQQATQRAGEIVRQAVDGMSPKPILRQIGPSAVGACVADDHDSRERAQLSLSYQLTGVPGTEAKNLVRQARDAWVKQGYEFQSSDGDGDWSDPFPSVDMRTKTDDFWMGAVTGVVDRAKGDGLAAITVTSPCFDPVAGSETAGASPASTRTDPEPHRRVLRHSSRIYDALQVPYAPTRLDRELRVVEESDGDVSIHHAWSTAPLAPDQMLQAMRRAREYFAGTGWAVRDVAPPEAASALIARFSEDGSLAQVVPAATGGIRVAVTTPAAPMAVADA